MVSYKIFTRTTGIYSITCKTTGRKYVGQSKCVAGRWKQHLYELKRGTHHCSSFQEEYNLYGYTNFVFQIELICSKKTLTENEQKIWDTFSNNYNGRPTGRIFPEPTPETRRKISEAQKGNTYTKGYKHSTETRRNMSEAQKGKKLSAEHKRKISGGLKNMSAENKLARIGRTHSEETKKNISEARKKPILQYSLEFGFIVEWASAKDASKATGISKSCIGMCCRGERKTAGGYLWKYKDA